MICHPALITDSTPNVQSVKPLSYEECYSQEKYEVSVSPNGEFTGKPEDAFLASAVYLDIE